MGNIVKKSNKNSTSSVFSHRNYAMHECALGNEWLTKILVAYCNLIISNQCYLKRRWKIVSIILEKGKGPMLGELRIMKWVEADFQLLMRFFVNKRIVGVIETDEIIPKGNFGSRKWYSIDNLILEKRLLHDYSMQIME